MDYQNIEELYSYLESDTKRNRRQRELTSDFKKLADILQSESEKEKVVWECSVFDFSLVDGMVKPLHSSTKEDGITIWQYPSFDNFNDKGYEYLKARASAVRNDYLIARYNQVLWNNPTRHKHEQQAKNAIDAYINLLNKTDCIKEQRLEEYDCLEILKNCFSLALQIKYREENVKEITRAFLFKKNKFPNDLKIFLLKFMADQKQLKKADFKGTLEILLKIGNQKKKEKPDYFQTKEIYLTGLTVAQKIGSSTKIWNKRIGDSIYSMAEHRMDDKSRMIPLGLYQEALSYYKLSGNKNKVKEAESKYSELKKELKLNKVRIPLSDQHFDALQKYLDIKTKNLLEREPNEIIEYLTVGEDIFPKNNWLKESAEKSEKNLFDYFTTMKFDINNNISKANDDKSSKLKVRMYENYNQYFRFAVLPYLHRIFVDGQLKKKITFETVTLYFAKETWLGQKLIESDSGGDEIEYNWISLIAPSFLEYFIQTESTLKSNNPYSNFILAIDSLTMKFEGVLRDFARFCKISTTKLGKKNVLREKYIEELLSEKELQKYFNEDDLLLFNFLFVSKDGMNLRNNIAHCFFRYRNYNFQFMHLLICAFLRIGKYKLVSSK